MNLFWKKKTFHQNFTIQLFIRKIIDGLQKENKFNVKHQQQKNPIIFSQNLCLYSMSFIVYNQPNSEHILCFLLPIKKILIQNSLSCFFKKKKNYENENNQPKTLLLIQFESPLITATLKSNCMPPKTEPFKWYKYMPESLLTPTLILSR